MTSNHRNAPAVILSDEDLGTLGYLSWLHHAMWCPDLLRQIQDPRAHFEELDERMERRIRGILAQEDLSIEQLTHRRREVETTVLTEMGMPTPEVSAPVWAPEEPEDDSVMAQMAGGLAAVDEAIDAVRQGSSSAEVRQILQPTDPEPPN